MEHSFLVHNEGDHVGVAVRDIEAGIEAEGLIIDSGRHLRVTCISNIPLGHKLALVDLSQGSPVLKYKIKIGVATSSIRAGDYVHTHNLRSTRW